MVRAVSDTALTLAAADGRTLKFEAVPGKSFPEELKKAIRSACPTPGGSKGGYL
ncbi:MAG: hypothetical protein ACLVJ8_08270 [Ruthenibacterium lactatiformans]